LYQAWSNWGIALSDQARTKTGAEADTLFAEAVEKYAEALRIKPDDHEAWSNWGVALSEQAKTKTGAEADTLFAQAAEKYAEVLRIKPGYRKAQFNMACLYALRAAPENAVQWLHKWADGNPAATKSKIQDDDDFDPIRETETFKQFLTGLPS